MEYPMAWIRAVLTTTPARWNELAAALPPGLLQRPPAPGEWSALECLQHMIDTENVFQFRVRALLQGQDFPAFNPDEEGAAPGETPPAAVAARFAQLRAESLELLARVGEADLPRSARHAELGPVTLGQMLHEWAGHDLMHTVQAERALMQPFIEGCGPWQIYFTDHVAARG